MKRAISLTYTTGPNNENCHFRSHVLPFCQAVILPSRCTDRAPSENRIRMSLWLYPSRDRCNTAEVADSLLVTHKRCHTRPYAFFHKMYHSSVKRLVLALQCSLGVFAASVPGGPAKINSTMKIPAAHDASMILQGSVWRHRQLAVANYQGKASRDYIDSFVKGFTLPDKEFQFKWYNPHIPGNGTGTFHIFLDPIEKYRFDVSQTEIAEGVCAFENSLNGGYETCGGCQNRTTVASVNVTNHWWRLETKKGNETFNDWVNFYIPCSQ